MWQTERLAKFTAFEIYKLFVEPKTIKDRDAGVWSETAMTYIFEKAVEQVTGWRKEIQGAALTHGVSNEHEAFEAFEKIYGLGFQLTSTTFFKINEFSGASPDGVLYGDNLDEIQAVLDVKCPFNPISFYQQKKQHIEAQNEFQGVPKEYYYQLQMQMLATGCKTGYLVRYLTSTIIDNYGNKTEFDLPVETRLFYTKLTYDEAVGQQILEKVQRAEETKQKLINELINEKVNAIA